MGNKQIPEPITPEQAGTLSGLFYERVQRSPDKLAYRYYDTAEETWCDLSWAEAGARVARWQAALANGLVIVPLYTQDRAENVAYILQNAGVKLLLLGDQEH